ncbi:hypothetical protein [Algirhabdus cladophorae]|uniref:hypothetical protein n=1 Tax=Algirhabdus cladophorae TaxID=3377108 RepID=UPI003B84B187
MEKDPACWRFNLAFYAVHLPSLIAVVTYLDDLVSMTGIDEGEKRQILKALHQAKSLAATARQTPQEKVPTDLKVKAKVLSNYAKAPDAALPQEGIAPRGLNQVSKTSAGLTF